MDTETVIFENKDTGALLLALGDGWRACIGANGTKPIDRAELTRLQQAGKVLIVRLAGCEWEEYKTPGNSQAG